MGLGEILGFSSKVIVEYKADTKDIKAKLKDLSGDERKFAEDQLKSAEARNKSLDQQAKGYGMLTAAIAASAAGLALAVKGIDAYGKSSEAAGAEVKKMKDGIGAAFDSFAISIGKTVMAFEPLISGVASLVKILGDLHIAGPAAIAALGYAISGNPKVAALLAAVGLAMQISSAAGVQASSAVDEELAEAGYRRDAAGDFVRIASAPKSAPVDLGLTGTDETGLGGLSLTRMSARVDNAIGQMVSGALGVDAWSGGIKWNKGGKDESGYTVTSPFRTTGASGVRTGSGIGDVSVNQNEDAQRMGVANGSTLEALKKSLADGAGAVSRDMEKFNRAQTESKLAGIFGPLDEFNAYTMAFDTLSGAVGSAMTAWIDGSMSAGKAFKAFVGEAIKGISIQMAMEALKHGAYAIGALAMGDAKGAALHGTSAAKFAAGAIVAAGAAKALGSSGASAGSGPGAPSLGGGAGGSQPQPGTQTIIAYGDSFAEDSPRQRLLRAGRIVSRVRGTSGIEYA